MNGLMFVPFGFVYQLIPLCWVSGPGQRRRGATDLRDAAPRVALWAGGLSLLLEVARGWYPDTGASVLLWVFTVVAALFGGWLYLLQRDHVRALVERRRLLAPLAAEKPIVARAA